MAELDYSPNALAAGLAGGRTRLLALLFPSLERGISEPDFEYLVAAADAARERDYRVILWTTDRHDIGDVEPHWRGGLIEGLLLMEVLLEDQRVDLLQRKGIPVTLIGRTADSEGVPYADRDFEQDAGACVDHLAGLGHTNVALITPPEEIYARGFGAVVRPVDALRASARSAGLDLTLIPCAATPTAGGDALTSLRTRQPDVTAVISLVDEATMGLFHKARDVGVHVPDDLSVISLSASPRRSSWFSPGLTSISPPSRSIGRSAALALIGLLDGSAADPPRSLWSGQLVDRGSTTAARGTSRSARREPGHNRPGATATAAERPS